MLSFNVEGKLCVPIRTLLRFVLRNIGCWCAETEWPWLRNRLAKYLRGLDSLPECFWQVPWPGFKMPLSIIYSLVEELVCTCGEAATVEQLLNKCITLGEYDCSDHDVSSSANEAYSNSDSDEFDYSYQDIGI